MNMTVTPAAYMYPAKGKTEYCLLHILILCESICGANLSERCKKNADTQAEEISHEKADSEPILKEAGRRKKVYAAVQRYIRL